MQNLEAKIQCDKKLFIQFFQFWMDWLVLGKRKNHKTKITVYERTNVKKQQQKKKNKSANEANHEQDLKCIKRRR